eukprot:TRINITY_DN23272_c0_g1_i1.p1 TRINITY_DN23272_c0_g1~~TRINITY_DN23272_c0_g1_i1.p1  ORF type:complete len:513 (+),score=120.21 TRINITY_DN23272_c0_g1_i1:75-1613(+)
MSHSRLGGKATTAALVASLGAFLFGLDIGYIAPILECPSFKRDVGHLRNWQDESSAIDPASAGFIVGVFSLGCIATSLPPVSSYFLDEFGRRSSIIMGGAFFLLGCALQAGSNSLLHFLSGRLVTGTAIGLLSSVVPLYQAEMAPPHLRGTLTSMYNMMVTTGIFVAALIDQFLVGIDGGWRRAIMIQTVPALVILAAMPFLPRSPRWLVQQGRQQEAEQALIELRAGPAEGDSRVDDAGMAVAKQELAEIVEEFEAECKAGGSIRWEDLVSGRLGALVAVGASLQLLQQLVGMNAFMYFGPRIFGGFFPNPNTFQTLANAVNMLSTLPALYLIEKTGRQYLLARGAAGMALCCFLLGLQGVAFTSQTGDKVIASSSAVAFGMAATVFGYIGCFACTWGPVVWVYCAEIYPLRYRARCLGVTTTMNWVGNFVIAQSTPVLLEVFGFSTFWIFGCFCIAALLLALWLPETRGVPLEQVSSLFEERLRDVGIEDKATLRTVEAGYGATSSGVKQ